MKIEEIVKAVQKCLDAKIGSKDWISIRSLLYGTIVHVRDTKTFKIFEVNYYGKYKEYNECGPYIKSAIFDLDGDYEYYDPVRVYGVGYLIPNEQVESDDKEEGSEENITLSTILERAQQRKEIRFCGNGGDFYISSPSVEVKTMSISEYARHNYYRKKIGVQHSIPFDMNMPNNAYVILLIDCQDSYNSEHINNTWFKLDELFGNYGSIIKLNLKTSYGFNAN